MKWFRISRKTRYQRLSEVAAAVQELATDIPLPETAEDEQALRLAVRAFTSTLDELKGRLSVVNLVQNWAANEAETERLASIFDPLAREYKMDQWVISDAAVSRDYAAPLVDEGPGRIPRPIAS